MRQVLKGVLFRSGTPTEAGLQRLCQQGFRRAYSLYGARTTAHGPRNQAMERTGKDQRSCKLPDGGEGTIEWRSGPASRGRSLPRILQDVLSTVKEPERGPVLVHCWNGLHYAGMVSAMVLRQLCGVDADTAEAYWRDTANPGANYPSVIRHIRAFRPLPGYALSAEDRRRLCPSLPPPPRPQAQVRSKTKAE